MLLYKEIKRILTRGVLAALCLGGMASCVYDTYEDLQGHKEALKPGKYYVALDFENVASNGSRATLVDGDETENEHTIGADGNFILFFDESQTLTEVVELRAVDNHANEDNIETRYIAIIYVDADYEQPTYAMALLNAERYAAYLRNGELNGLTASEIMSQRWDDAEDPTRIGRDSNGYFTMSNAVYKNADGKWIDLVELPEDAIQIVDEPVDEEKIVKIRVERMVAKSSLEFTGDKLIRDGDNIWYENEKDQMLFKGFDTDGIHEYFSKVNWRVKVTGWGLNALETSSYLFRKVNSNGDYFDGWMDPANYRVYWSEDPHYTRYEATYPWQTLRAVNNKDVPYYLNHPNVLLNFSYNQFVNAHNFDKNLYVPENTYDFKDDYIANNLDDRTDYLAGTHLILTAELETDLGGGTDYKANTVFRDRTRILYENARDCFRALTTSFNYALASQENMKFTYYNWDDDSDDRRGKYYYASSHGSKFALYLNGSLLNTTNPPQLASYYQPAYVQNGDGKILTYVPGLSIENTTTGEKIRVYDENGVDVTATMDHNNIVKSLLLEWVGPVDHFVDGKMYYFAPLNITKGRAGTVRNGWYQFVLSGINTIGTSVSLPDNPIVPNKVYIDQQMIDIEVQILPWHLGLDAVIDESTTTQKDAQSNPWNNW